MARITGKFLWFVVVTPCGGIIHGVYGAALHDMATAKAAALPGGYIVPVFRADGCRPVVGTQLAGDV